VANVRPADGSRVANVEVYYTLGEKPPPNRFWRRAETVRSERSWQARLPVVRTRDPLRAFANVYYQSGVCLSTNLARATPDRLGAARASLSWSASPKTEKAEPGAPFVFATANTDPNVSIAYFVRSDDAIRPDAVCINPAIFGERINFAIVSHYIGDRGYAGRDGLSLAFEYQGDFLRDSRSKAEKAQRPNDSDEPGFTVLVTAHDWTPQSKSYLAHVSAPTPGTGWQRVELAVSRFVAADAKPLASWRDLDKLEIRGVGSKRNPPRFARFEWVAR
jgi:hypothetical protein